VDQYDEYFNTVSLSTAVHSCTTAVVRYEYEKLLYSRLLGLYC
jgi:hypothetical protein